ncbi:MAG: rhodanese-like domain-containing protein [Pseudomonadota bacterium]
MTEQAKLNITVTELGELLQAGSSSISVIDVRDPEEFEAGHIKGARNVPLTELAPLFDHPESTEALVMVCESGLRSIQAANFAKIAGLANVQSLEGGMLAWREIN